MNSYDQAKFNYVYVEAIKQKLLGNGGDALKYLEEAIKINPESDAAYYQMAQIVSANGDLENGKKFLKKALAIDNEEYLVSDDDGRILLSGKKAGQCNIFIMKML